MITRDTCVMEDGTYYGDGIECYTVACDPTQSGPVLLTGACCYDGDSCADLQPDDCNTSGGVYFGVGSDCYADDCPTAPAGAPEAPSLIIVLASWGACPEAEECPGDLNRDGEVDFTDLTIVLALP